MGTEPERPAEHEEETNRKSQQLFPVSQTPHINLVAYPSVNFLN